MSEPARTANASHALRIPLWDEYGQAQRFAGVLALLGLLAALRRALLGELVVAGVCFATGAVLLALCLWPERGAPRQALAVGTPAVLTLAALALLALTGGRSVAAAAQLAVAPAVAALWGSSRSGWLFLAAVLASVAGIVALVPAEPVTRTEPWIADAHATWMAAPVAAALLLLARSWLKAQGDWREEVVASHAVLSASEARFKAYIENAHDVIAELDGEGRLLFVSASRDGQYSLPVADLLGTDAAKYLLRTTRRLAREPSRRPLAGIRT